MFKKSDYYIKNSDGSLSCVLCPRKCKFVKNGQRGFCFMRGRKNNKVGLMDYGKLIAIAIDPIEKKPLYHFLPGSKALSFGTVGCNMGCLFCQNWDITKIREEDAMTIALKPDEIVKLAIEKQCESVAYTYNDPNIFFEYVKDCALKCRKKGIKNIAVTAGYINPKPRKEFYSFIDAVNIDLKGFSEEFYKNIINAKLKPVLDTIDYVKNKTNCWLEITNLLIPGKNDDDKMIKDMCKWIKRNLGTEIPLHFSAFYPCYKMTDVEPTSISTVIKARDIAINEGLKYVYTGNVNSIETSITYCPKCKKPLIVRNGYNVTVKALSQEKCGDCGEKIAGVF
jgi:pyruvate formate lyase activating enzyme